MCKAIELLVFSILIGLHARFIVNGCAPPGGGKPGQQHCLTFTLRNVPGQLIQALTQPDSAKNPEFALARHAVMVDMDRISAAKDWRKNLNPPPKFCRFEIPGQPMQWRTTTTTLKPQAADATTTTGPSGDLEALVDIWTHVDNIADVQAKLDPANAQLDPPPPYPLSAIKIVPGACPTSGNAMCFP